MDCYFWGELVLFHFGFFLWILVPSFSAFQLFCFSVFLCFSALPCWPAFLRFPASLFLCFFASLLLWFSAFLLFSKHFQTQNNSGPKNNSSILSIQPWKNHGFPPFFIPALASLKRPSELSACTGAIGFNGSGDFFEAPPSAREALEARDARRPRLCWSSCRRCFCCFTCCLSLAGWCRLPPQAPGLVKFLQATEKIRENVRES